MIPRVGLIAGHLPRAARKLQSKQPFERTNVGDCQSSSSRFRQNSISAVSTDFEKSGWHPPRTASSFENSEHAVAYHLKPHRQVVRTDRRDQFQGWSRSAHACDEEKGIALRMFPIRSR